MRELWKFENKRFEADTTKQKIFLILNTVIWSTATFLAGILIGLFFKLLGRNVLLGALLTACYAGVFVGFMGGCIFLMRNTTVHR